MNFLEEQVKWSVALKSITHVFEETISKTLAIQEEEDIPKNASEHVPVEEGFSSDPKKFFNFSNSSLFNSEIELCVLPSLFR